MNIFDNVCVRFLWEVEGLLMVVVVVEDSEIAVLGEFLLLLLLDGVGIEQEPV